MKIFKQNLIEADPILAQIIKAEQRRQHEFIELIASENFVSSAVLEAQGSVLTNKYAEGYPGKRYYNGCHEVDKAENLAILRAKELFGCAFANVQPHSGSQANQAVYLALLEPGDVILGMSMDSGGHLTHGAAPNLSGKWFKPVSYTVRRDNYLIDYDEVERLSIEHKPKLIIAGYSCYSRTVDFARFRSIADKIGAYLLADIAHIAGIVATGQHPSPFPHAHVVTSTTHKTLRGPRGGLILTNDELLAKKIDLALFPGLQGGPLLHVIAAKAVAFGENLRPEFNDYIKQVLKNAKALSRSLLERGYDVVSGGTDNHMVIVDLRAAKLTGKAAANSLDRAYITCNKNNVPFDDASPFVTSGLRLGTSACTTRGFGEAEFKLVAHLIADVLDGLQNNLAKGADNSTVEQQVKEQVLALNQQFALNY